MLGGVRVGLSEGKLIANPSYEETREGELSIMVAGTEEGIVMVEAGAQQVSEEHVVEAIEFGHECCRKIVAGIRELMGKVGKTKWVYEPPKPTEAISRKIAASRARRVDRRDEYAEICRRSTVITASTKLKKKAVALFPEEEQAEAGKAFRRI